MTIMAAILFGAVVALSGAYFGNRKVWREYACYKNGGPKPKWLVGGF